MLFLSILAGKRAICSGVSESRGSEIKEGGRGGKEAQKFYIQSVLSRVCAHSKQQHLQTREMCWAQVPHRRFFPPNSYDSYSISTTSSSYSSSSTRVAMHSTRVCIL